MRYIFAVPLLVSLVACSGREDTPTSEPVATDSAEVVDTSTSVKMPGGVELSTPVHLRSDKTYKTKTGATRRKLVYELLEADSSEAQPVVTAMLVEAGFEAQEPKTGADGKVSIKYRKKKTPSITATFYPGLAKKPANPAAKSMVAFSWQTKKAPKKS